jgi:hypothetical protein
MQTCVPDTLTTISSIAGLISALFAIPMAFIAMWQSVHFYRMSNDAGNRLLQAIADLAVSARSTEATTTQVTTRALDVLAGHFEQRVEQAEREGRMRVAESVARALSDAPPQDRHDAQAAATRAISETFTRLKTSVAPTSEDYDWGPFIRRMSGLQRNNLYLSIKWLHQKVFASEPGMQEALQIAIELRILDTYRRHNPVQPRYPTLCCKLNREHHLVRETLRSNAVA